MQQRTGGNRPGEAVRWGERTPGGGLHRLGGAARDLSLIHIFRYIQQGLAAGTIQDGDELPSRRVVSALLAVNPNTVQKAFKLLEDEGLATSRAGAKSCIQASPQQIEALRQAMLEREMQAMVDAARRMGLSREEAHRLLDALYDKEGAEV